MIGKQDHWESDIKVFKDCGYAKEECQEPIVSIDFLTQTKIREMSKAMGNIEWLGYLVGTFDREASIYSVTDIRVPKQDVTATTVEVTESLPLNDIIGSVHSHHNMGAFHSSTDHDFVGANHDVCLVYSTNGWSGKVRQRVPCGHEYLYDAIVLLPLPEGYDPRPFVTENQAKITKGVLAPVKKQKARASQTTTLPTALKWKDGKRQCDLCDEFFTFDKMTHYKQGIEDGWFCETCLPYLVNPCNYLL